LSRIRWHLSLLPAAFLAAGLAGAFPRSNAQPSGAAPSAPVDDQGTFVLSLGGQEFGTEKFSIKTSGKKVIAEAEIELREQVGSQTVVVKTSPKLVLDSDLRPLSYTWSVRGAGKYSLAVDFTSSPARSKLKRPNGEDDVREFKLPRDVVVLDNNVIHHYQLLLDRYNRTSGGKQNFSGYIPQSAVPGALTVQDAGMQTVKMNGQEEELKRVVVVTDNARIDLWVDAQGRLQRLFVPMAQLQAVRKQ
jgi:hypothetical protein